MPDPVGSDRGRGGGPGWVPSRPCASTDRAWRLDRTGWSRPAGAWTGSASPADLRPGDVVSLHWDWVCDRLSPAALKWLRYCTLRNLAAVNSLAVPGPAAVCNA